MAVNLRYAQYTNPGHALAVAELLYLVGKTPFHSGYTMSAFEHCLLMPMLAGHSLIFRGRHDHPVGFISWGLVSDGVLAELRHNGMAGFSQDCLNSGDNLLILDLICAGISVWQVKALMLAYPPLKAYDRVYFIRQKDDNFRFFSRRIR